MCPSFSRHPPYSRFFVCLLVCFFGLYCFCKVLCFVDLGTTQVVAGGLLKVSSDVPGTIQVIPRAVL